MISLLEQIACIRRECALRQAAYPAQIARGTLTQAWADYQLSAMAAVLRTLETLHDTEEGDGQAVRFITREDDVCRGG